MKAFANPARLEIIEMLSQGEKSVKGVVEATNLTVANASQHLQALKNNNIVKSRKAGHYVYYSLINDDFLPLYQHIIKYAVSEIHKSVFVLTDRPVLCSCVVFCFFVINNIRCASGFYLGIQNQRKNKKQYDKIFVHLQI